ncbi:MAG: CopG family transcriptional regulator [Firmicutes bacterium]|nr:CopG family transcriptional regulator [Bacillota bacterium]
MDSAQQRKRENATKKSRVGVAAIIIQDRLAAAPIVNSILSEYGDIIVGRMGIPYKDRQISVISLILDGDTDTIGAMTGKLGAIDGVKSRVTLVPLEGKGND